MLNWLLSLFKKVTNPVLDPENPVKQTGLIVEPPRPTDWMGDESGIVGVVRMPDGDWTAFAPTAEKQYKTLYFDTLSCATFSALNLVETFIKYLKPTLPKEHLDFFKRFNFIDENGDFNASDNFTAVMSDTTRQGNTFPKVWDSIRNDGLVSEKDYPFGGDTFDQFHDKTRITPYMKLRAKKFLDYFTVQYAWCHFTNGRQDNSQTDIQLMQNALKESPLQIGIVIPATHAEELLQFSGGYKTFYNTYEPYISKFEDIYNPIHFSVKAVLIPKLNAPQFPTPSTKFVSQLSLGMTSSEVMALQKILMYFGFMNVATGYYGPVTQNAVKDFQTFYGLQPVGEVGPQTRAVLNGMFDAPLPVTKTKGQILYETAVKCLGRDLTPDDTIPDEVDCAETTNAVYKQAFGVEIGGGASTNAMYKALLANTALFKRVTAPLPGDIVISPTGYGNGNLSNGHVGIIGVDGAIMSNSSSTGRFSQNFTQESWRQRYVDKGGFPMAFFRRV